MSDLKPIAFFFFFFQRKTSASADDTVSENETIGESTHPEEQQTVSRESDHSEVAPPFASSSASKTAEAEEAPLDHTESQNEELEAPTDAETMESISQENVSEIKTADGETNSAENGVTEASTVASSINEAPLSGNKRRRRRSTDRGSEGTQSEKADAPEENKDTPLVQNEDDPSKRNDGKSIEPKPEENDLYQKPPLELLIRSSNAEQAEGSEEDERKMRIILETLGTFGVKANPVGCVHGPFSTRYEIQPGRGVKVSSITRLQNEIDLNLGCSRSYLEAPVPGKAAIGISVPNESVSLVTLGDVLADFPKGTEDRSVVVALGKDRIGAPVFLDLVKETHVLIAGTTGSGKSACINSMICSILFRYSPNDVRLILINPFIAELFAYNGIPHLLLPVVTSNSKAVAVLDWIKREMEHRLRRFEALSVKDIEGFNALVETKMYRIVVFIDDLSDLTQNSDEVEENLIPVLMHGRKAGIHFVISTQRISSRVIPESIRSLIDTRISFYLPSKSDSQLILGRNGAESLRGKGDMIFLPDDAPNGFHVQGCYVTDSEIQQIVAFFKEKYERKVPDAFVELIEEEMKRPYHAATDGQFHTRINSLDQMNNMQPVNGNMSDSEENSTVDEMLAKAIELAIDSGQISISMLQRQLRIGYARAGRLLDEMTLRGITAESGGNAKPRQVLITREEWNRMKEEDGF